MAETNQNISEKRTNEEEIKRLYKKAIEQGSEEAKYFLKLEVWDRDGLSFHEYKKYEVIYGEVEEIDLGGWSDNHGYVGEVLIIPKEIPTVIYYWEDISYHYDGQAEYIYIFTSNGWKCIRVK
ncbi:MAG: hypothetical protein ACP5G1_04140 [Nanopusillaceae archaeon]